MLALTAILSIFFPASGTRDGERMLQAYLLLDQAAGLLAVEQSERALSALKAGADAAGLGGRVTVKVRNLFAPRSLNTSSQALTWPFLIHLAAEAAQCKMLAKTDIAKIAMISCNPSSFARDAAILINAGFKLDWVQVIDQFLFSNHLEIVGAFNR